MRGLMKWFLTPMVLMVGLAVLAPPPAEAGHRTVRKAVRVAVHHGHHEYRHQVYPVPVYSRHQAKRAVAVYVAPSAYFRPRVVVPYYGY